MNKKEILEIKKQFIPENCTITRISTCYVTSEKEIALQKTEAFLSLPEEEAFKYFDIFRKSLSGSKGKNLYDVELPTIPADREDYLYGFKESKLTDDKKLDDFFEQTIASYDTTGNFLIILIHACYDIPGKTGNGEEMWDASDEVYDFILCCICPVSLSKPGLSVDMSKGRVEDRIRDWVVAMPEDAFLYPAFNDRSADVHSLLYYSKKSPIAQELFFEWLTGKEEHPLSKEEECSFVSDTLQNVSNDGVPFETIQELNSRVLEQMTDQDEMEAAPETFGNLLLECGLSENVEKQFLDVYKETVGKKPIHLNSLTDTRKMTVKTSNAIIKIEVENMHELKTKEVDGRMCLVLPLEENHLEVNGIDVVPVRR